MRWFKVVLYLLQTIALQSRPTEAPGWTAKPGVALGPVGPLVRSPTARGRLL
jgi:hypothetical protein